MTDDMALKIANMSNKELWDHYNTILEDDEDYDNIRS